MRRKKRKAKEVRAGHYLYFGGEKIFGTSSCKRKG
jgi:hypothetical protein